MKRCDLKGYCIGAAEYEDTYNYHQFLETNAGEEFKKGYEKARTFCQKALEETVGREMADYIQDISAFNLIDFGTPLATYTKRYYPSEEDFYNGTDPSNISGYDVDGSPYFEWEAVYKYKPLITDDVLKSNDPEKAGMKIFDELVRVNFSERVLADSKYEKAFNNISGKFQEKLIITDALSAVAKANGESEGMVEFLEFAGEKIANAKFGTAYHPDTYESDDPLFLARQKNDQETELEKVVNCLKCNAFVLLDEYEQKNGQNTDIKERIEKVRQKQPEIINFLEKKSTRKGLETALENEKYLNYLKQQEVNDIIGNIELCNEKHSEVPQENKKVQKM